MRETNEGGERHDKPGLDDRNDGLPLQPYDVLPLPILLRFPPPLHVLTLLSSSLERPSIYINVYIITTTTTTRDLFLYIFQEKRREEKKARNGVWNPKLFVQSNRFGSEREEEGRKGSCGGGGREWITPAHELP